MGLNESDRDPPERVTARTPQVHYSMTPSPHLQQLPPQLLAPKLLNNTPVHLQAAGVEVNVAVPRLAYIQGAAVVVKCKV